MTKFEVGKTYQTRGGVAARVVAIRNAIHTEHPIVAIYGSHETIETYALDGCWRAGKSPSDMDLMIPKVPFSYTKWANVYPDHRVRAMHNTKHHADAYAEEGRIACVQVTIAGNEGDGL